MNKVRAYKKNNGWFWDCPSCGWAVTSDLEDDITIIRHCSGSAACPTNFYADRYYMVELDSPIKRLYEKYSI